jgi:hypothetical protein
VYVFCFSAGKPWTYRLEIKRATNLPVFCELAYVSYDFFGESFTTGTHYLLQLSYACLRHGTW